MPATFLLTNGEIRFLDTAEHLSSILLQCVKLQEVSATLSMNVREEWIKELYVELAETYGLDDYSQLRGIGIQLDAEIRDFFLLLLNKESKLQDRYGNVLIDKLLKIFIPAYKSIARVYDILNFTHKSVRQEFRFIEHIPANTLYVKLCVILFSWCKYIIENLKIFVPELYNQHKEALFIEKIYADLTNKEIEILQPAELKVKLQWKGDKTDLAELVWALFKSERITDTSTGIPVTQKELVKQLIDLLGLNSLDVANLMKTKYGTKSKATSYKAQDGKTFLAELQKLLVGRILD